MGDRNNGIMPENVYFRLCPLKDSEKMGYIVEVYCDRSEERCEKIKEIPMHLSWDEWYEIRDFFSKVSSTLNDYPT